MFFAGFPQPWRTVLLGLLIAFVAVFVVGLVSNVNDGLITGILVAIVTLQIAVRLYLRGRGLEPPPPPRRARQYVWWITIGLGLGIVITALNGGFASKDGSSSGPPLPPGPSPERLAHTTFRSPSGVACRTTANEARCGVTDWAFTPPSGSSTCGEGQPYVVGAAAGPTQFGCAAALPAADDARVIPVGGSVRRGPVACNVLSGGVQCRSHRTRISGGFLISSAQLRIF